MPSRNGGIADGIVVTRQGQTPQLQAFQPIRTFVCKELEGSSSYCNCYPTLPRFSSGTSMAVLVIVSLTNHLEMLGLRGL